MFTLSVFNKEFIIIITNNIITIINFNLLILLLNYLLAHRMKKIGHLCITVAGQKTSSKPHHHRPQCITLGSWVT